MAPILCIYDMSLVWPDLFAQHLVTSPYLSTALHLHAIIGQTHDIKSLLGSTQPLPISQCYTSHWYFMMKSSNGNIFRITDHLCREFTGLCAGNLPTGKFPAQRQVNSPHKWPVMWKMFPFDDFIMKYQCYKCSSSHQLWRGVLMFSLICSSINGWVINHKAGAGDLRHHHAHYDVIVMYVLTPNFLQFIPPSNPTDNKQCVRNNN